MAKIIVMYEKPKNEEGFEKYYYDVHVPLVQKVPNLKNATINRVVQSQNTDLSFYLIAQLEFESMEDLNSMFASNEGKQVIDDVKNLAEYLHKPPIISIAE